MASVTNCSGTIPRYVLLYKDLYDLYTYVYYGMPIINYCPFLTVKL